MMGGLPRRGGDCLTRLSLTQVLILFGETSSHSNKLLISFVTFFASPLSLFSFSLPFFFIEYAMELNLYANDRKSSQAICSSRSSCFSFVIFRVCFILVTLENDWGFDNDLKAAGFVMSCCVDNDNDVVDDSIDEIYDDVNNDDDDDNDNGNIDEGRIERDSKIVSTDKET